jgi:lipopolysaccharide transport system ATP-binding protein
MTDIAIRVEHLAKQYRIGGAQKRSPTLRDAVIDSLAASLRRLATPSSNGAQRETIWALRDVSFEVKRGEVVGIIGRNGAGKSTLLKILSSITTPTEGRVQLFGRVGSLLEVGTGFHAELTGRENIFLNGAILGMKRTEIARKFDEIVEFAEVEKFIDTPVKHYSSGMYVRLAFAVAAHLEPEILLVDEVLAVGDAQFQKKCLGKMRDVSAEGRTVLFVSHSMTTVNRLCQIGILLNAGCLKLIDRSDVVISAYLASAESQGESIWSRDDLAPGNGKLRLRAVRVLDSDNEISSNLDIRKSFFVEIEYEIFNPIDDLRVTYQVLTQDGVIVFTSSDKDASNHQGIKRGLGLYASRCEVPGDFLNAGVYSIAVSCDIPYREIIFREDNVLNFQVERTGGPGGHYSEQWKGVVCPNLNWQIQIR